MAVRRAQIFGMYEYCRVVLNCRVGACDKIMYGRRDCLSAGLTS